MPTVPTYSIDWDSLLSTTMNNTRGELYDQIFGSNPFFAWLHANDRKVLLPGGAKIQRTLEYAENATVKALETGYDEIDLTPQEIITTAVDEWREIAGSVSISRREMHQNSSEAQIIDLLQAKINNLGKSFAQELARQILAPSGASLSAATGEINPLTVLVSDTNQADVHGISSSTFDWWRPGRVDGNGVTTFVGFKDALIESSQEAAKHNEGFPDIILTSPEGYRLYLRSMQGQVRYQSSEMGRLGFDTVSVDGTEMMWDRRCPRFDTGTGLVNFDDAGADRSNFYFLNSDYFWLAVDSGSDMVQEPFMKSQNQLAQSAVMVFMGNLMTTNMRTHTILYDVDDTIVT